MKKIIIGKELSLEEVFAVATDEKIEVTIDEKAILKIKKNRALVDNILKQDKPVYGINTGFGSLSDVKIDNDKLKNLQINLIRSHSAGVGKPLGQSFVRAMMLLRAHNLSYGYSGVREEVIHSILFFLNNNKGLF